MNATTYNALADVAGHWLLRREPTLFAMARLPAWPPPAVYVALDRRWQVRYVGSVARASRDGIADRILEHRWRSGQWSWIVILALRPETPTPRVRQIEGAIGSILWPAENRRLPVSDVPGRPAAARPGSRAQWPSRRSSRGSP